jgi:hypothetical protein
MHGRGEPGQRSSNTRRTGSARRAHGQPLEIGVALELLEKGSTSSRTSLRGPWRAIPQKSPGRPRSANWPLMLEPPPMTGLLDLRSFSGAPPSR